MDIASLSLEIEQRIEVQAPLEKAFEGLVRQLTDRNPMGLRLELWPGGRWYRDLGEGAGHLWGFVQVVKPPTLLEIQGPLFMSYPVSGHVQIRLTPAEGRTTIALRHRAFGLIEDTHRQGLAGGWQQLLGGIADAL